MIGAAEKAQQALGDRPARGLYAAVARERVQVLLDPQQRERPGARAAERRHRRKRGVEQRAGETVAARIGRASNDRAERPQRAAVAVLRPLLFLPQPRVRHEIAEAPQRAVEGMADECQVARRKRAHDSRIARSGVFEERHQQQRAGVVVEAITLFVARHVERGVLQHSGIVGHDLDANLSQVPRRERDEPAVTSVARQLREDRLPRVHEDHAALVAADARVLPLCQDPDQVGQLAGDLDAGEPAAGDEEGQQAPPLLRIVLDVRELEHRDDVITQTEAVVEGLELEGVLGEARVGIEVVARPEREHRVVVGKLEPGAVEPPARRDDLPLDVDPLDLRDVHAGRAKYATRGTERVSRADPVPFGRTGN